MWAGPTLKKKKKEKTQNEHILIDFVIGISYN